MGLSFTIKADGGEVVERLFAELRERLSDLSPLMSGISQYMAESTRGRFGEGKGPDGTPWKPSQRAMLEGGQTLVKSGLLRESIHSAHGRDFAAVETAEPRARGLHFGRTAPESVGAHTRLVHQVFGRPLPFGVHQNVREYVRNPNLPARPIFGLSVADRNDIGLIVSEYLRSSSVGH